MSKKVNEIYNLWLEHAIEDNDIIEELKSINANEKEIYERFYKDLEFGTAGLRGIIGAGTNRMNIYTVGKTTQGLANYLKSISKDPVVAISYDSRIKSKLFAEECACILAANGIKSYISKELQPTPVLSFAVRHFECNAGIMITASHNPAKYNGYKCYGSDGCQMTDVDANNVYSEVLKVNEFTDIKKVNMQDGLDKKLIEYIEYDFYQKYLEKVESQSINPGVCKGSGLKVVYTPLNGAGNKLVREILSRIGIKDISVVKEQENPDGNFSTCPYPNPEIKEALKLALDLADTVNPDLILATDPDSDRVGIAVKNENGTRLMTGNEVGIMLMNYILSCRKKNGTLPKNPIAVKTIVTSPLVDKICERYGCELKTVLTGFKYIGDQILRLEKVGEEDRYVFGFEESYGYLAGSYVRDKDAVVASMLICEMAAYYRKQGKNLVDVINDIYNEYGYYQGTTLNFNFEGSVGMEKMTKVMEEFRSTPLEKIAGMEVVSRVDYQKSESVDLENCQIKVVDLPKSNVLEYGLKGNLKVIIRPSGTEPKIKVYITSVGKDLNEANEKTQKITEFISNIINS